MKRINEFDRIIREKLEQIQPEFQPSHWDQLEQKLGLEDMLGPEADENAIDQAFRNKLENIQPTLEPGDWDLFEQKLDQSEAGTPAAEESVIDQSVYAKIHQLEVPYDPSTWKLLARRMDHEFRFVQSILNYKLAELGLMALVVFTLFRFLPDTFQPEIQFFPIPGYPETRQPIAGQEFDAPELTQVAEAPLENAAKNPIAEANIPAHNVVPPPPVIPATTEAITDEGSGEIRINPFTGTPLSPRSPQILASIPTLRKTLYSQTEAPSLSEYMEAVSSHQEDDILAILDPLASSDINGLQTDDRQLDLSLISNRQKPNLRLGMLGSLNYDRVITPPTQYEGDSLISLDRYALGYGGGISLGFEWGRWELETGMIYTIKQYQALPILFLDGGFREGYYGEGFKRIELHIINIPLHLRYNVYQRNRWRFYALGGASLQMAYQTNFFTANQEGFRSSNFNPQPAPPGGEPSGSPSGIEDKPRANGLFEGGSFHENSFISANIGVGIERYLSTRMSIFVQPTYQHSFYYLNGGRGFGPYADKINTMSIFGGVKVRLFNR